MQTDLCSLYQMTFDQGGSSSDCSNLVLSSWTASSCWLHLNPNHPPLPPPPPIHLCLLCLFECPSYSLHDWWNHLQIHWVGPWHRQSYSSAWFLLRFHCAWSSLEGCLALDFTKAYRANFVIRGSSPRPSAWQNGFDRIGIVSLTQSVNCSPCSLMHCRDYVDFFSQGRLATA